MIITFLSYLFLIFLCIFFSGFVIYYLISRSLCSQIFTTNNSPERKVAIVFGAGLNKDNFPTSVLRDRLDTAISLFKNGKVKTILLSGGNKKTKKNETYSMFQYTINHNIPINAIIVDPNGSSTFATCWRAKISINSRGFV